MQIYLLSGLGADKRIFSKLKLPDHLVIHHIEWIAPHHKETLTAYAARVAEQQIDSSEPFILLGLSFGGIIAVEIAKLHPARQVILISSVSCRQQIPWYYRLAGALRIDALIPASLLKSANPLMYRFFGALGKELQQLLKRILRDTDPQFMKWAIRMLPNWNHTAVLPNLLQIHGRADQVLPLKSDQVDVWVEQGGHLMVYAQHAEVSAILQRIIKDGDN